jgi:hypothetical protein
MTDYTIEAENLTLDGYSAQYNSSDASGGGYVQTWGTGSASTTFEGVTGTYTLDLGVFDENDGQSVIEILVNGEVVATVDLDQDLNGNYIYGTLTTVTVEGIDLEAGDELTFRGISNSGEAARLDNISFTRTGDLTDTTGTVTLLHEDFEGTTWNNLASYSSFTTQNGAAMTNATYDGFLDTRTVDLTGYTDAQISFDIQVAPGSEAFENSGTYGDYFDFWIETDAGWQKLDRFFIGADGKTFTGDLTGQVFGEGYGHLTYDVPEGATSVKLSFLSCITSVCEKILIDNLEVKAEPEVFIDAADDSITVFESEGAGDLETLDDGSASILENDTLNDGAYTGQVVTVNGVEGNVGAWIDLAEGGRVMINADGTVDFDADGDFEALNDGESAQITLQYTISAAAGGASDTATVTITVKGEDEPVVIDAVDDFITVFESEGAGDLEVLDDGSNSILENDTENGVDYTGAVIEVNGQTGNVGEFIDLDGGGRVMINADGSVDFDADGDFESLNEGDIAEVTVDYTIKSEQQANKPQNVLLVIDISNSTVGVDGQDVFDGTGVGDVNNDGRADTVLDAQIVAAKALIDDLRSQGLDPNLVNVGIVTFSGVDSSGASSYNQATVDSAVVGTFGLGNAGIDSALDSILSGSWTNYEAGLSEAENWFGANAQAGDGNTMYFLSDGRPITGFDPHTGEYVEQDAAVFLDEVGRIESNYGTTIHAIGVGANASLGSLNLIDNSGGAVQVTDAASLTATLLETSELVEAQDTATVTIRVKGETDVPLEAVDDFVIVTESEAAGDQEGILDSFADTTEVATITENDIAEGGGQYQGQVVTVNGVTGNVGEFIDLAGGGRVMINADGTLDFDADGDFEALNDGDFTDVTVDYEIQGPGGTGTPPKHNILFVIDVSGSTNNTFAGSPVGDQNGDGAANTILDAEIAAYEALIDQIQASGLTDADVDIGLVAFSGSNSADQSGASQFLGTFKPSQGSLEAALADLAAGGFTNFEAPLQTGLSWFTDQGATTADENIVYFLSDGFQNVGGDFADEAAQLQTQFGATVNAVGVGSGSNKDQLDVIDSDGDAQIVTTSDELTAVLVENGPVVPGQTDSATVTIRVTGETDVVPNILDDDDEAVTTDENTVVPITNLLANTTDPEAGTPSVISAGGQSTSTGAVTIAGTGGGLFTIASDGTASFDPNGEFEALGNGGTATSFVTYVVEDAAGDQVTSTATVTIKGQNDLTDDNEFTEVDEDAGLVALTNVLDNTVDPEAGSPSVASVGGVSTVNGAVELAGDNGGVFTISEDGTATFDTNGEYTTLGTGESVLTSISYEVVDDAGDTVTSTYEVLVQGDGIPGDNEQDPEFALKGTINRAGPELQTLTFVIDYSFSTFNDLLTQSGPRDLNGDSFVTVLDAMLEQIVTQVQTLDASTTPEVHFILAGLGGVVEEKTFQTTALQGAAGSADPANALQALFSQVFNQPVNTSDQLDVALALEAAVSNITAKYGATGKDLDDIVVLTTTTSTDFTNATFDPTGTTPGDFNGDGLVDPGFTDVSTALAGVAAIGADVDVVVIDGDQFAASDPLVAVDPDGIDIISNADNFGLENLIDDPSAGAMGVVVSVTVNGTDYAVSDDGIDGFSFILQGVTDDPTLGALVNIDGDGDLTTTDDVTSIDITNDLLPFAQDAFQFDLQLV